jgi:imidazole glycerol-phosphate synthase subunit HisH
MNTVIIDYGSGNLHSAHKAFERAATDFKIKGSVIVSNKASDIAKADRVVLPGVGAFKDCLNGLLALSGMREALQTHVIAEGKPFLGICVGMHHTQ